MKLSFVIPAYNEEKVLGNCLKSLERELKNNRHDVEVIVVNNASTDSTKRVALSFSFVKVIDEKRKGIVFARKAGFDVATGELIANIDSDTMLTEGWINKVFEEFEKHYDLVALSGPFIYFDLSSLRRFWVRLWYIAGSIIHFVNHRIFHHGAMLQGGNFVIKKEAFAKVGGYKPDKIKFYGEDTDVASRIQRVGRVMFSFGLPIMTSGRRLKSEGTIKTAWKYLVNFFWIIFFRKPYTEDYVDIRD